MNQLKLILISFPALIGLSQSQASVQSCQSARQQAVFVGAFKGDSRASELTLRIGSGVKDSSGTGYVAQISSKTQSCLATCYLKNIETEEQAGQLVSMDFVCQSPSFEAMSTPLNVTWTTEKTGKKTMLRIGSGFFGFQEKALRVKLDRLNVDSSPNRSPAILSRILERPAKASASIKQVASQR